MADTKNISSLVAAGGYVDEIDTIRGALQSAQASNWTGYSNNALGTVNFSNPGGYVRVATQWNGTAYVGFNLSMERAQITGPVLEFSLSGCVIGSNIGVGNPGFGFDVNDFFDYDRAANRYRLAISGSEKTVVDANTSWDLTQNVRQQSNVNLYGLINKTNAPLDQKIYIREVNDSQIRHFFQNDAQSANTIYDTVNRVGMTLTTRVLNEQGGRLVVGQGVVDDTVNALQTTTIKAQSLSLTAQPYAKVTCSASGTPQFSFSSSAAQGITIAPAGITVLIAGTYTVTLEQVVFDFASSVAARVDFQLYINGQANNYFACRNIPNQFQAFETGLQTTLRLLAGDVLTARRSDGSTAGGIAVIFVQKIC